MAYEVAPIMTEIKCATGVVKQLIEVPGVGTMMWNEGANLSLAIQICDSYRYQRELSLRAERGSNLFTLRVYKHPFRDDVVETTMTLGAAQRLLKKVVETATKYPTLVFNGSGMVNDSFRPRAEGFVHWHDQMLAGADPITSAKNCL